MNSNLIDRVYKAVNDFIGWLDIYGESSYDHQSFFSGKIGAKAKELYYNRPIVGTLAVAPMIFIEAFLPIGRRLFGKRLRFPIADAHYAMGFALLAKNKNKKKYYIRALHFIEELTRSRSAGFENYCWGYPFDWVTRNGTIPSQTPFITSQPYVYEAFNYLYNCDNKKKWLEVMRSIADHALLDIKSFELFQGCFSSGYSPYDNTGGVINASAYRAYLLTQAFIQFSDYRYSKAAEGNIRFIIKTQQQDGSWPYAIDGERDFVDHFHTCFIIKALAKIEKLTDRTDCWKAIEKGVKYYIKNLLDENLLPKPFSIAPRFTVYRRELYDYAECINLCMLLKDRLPELNKIFKVVVNDLLNRWIKKDGSFRSRELFFGWDNIPMHRWAQSQVFRSLCLIISKSEIKSSYNK